MATNKPRTCTMISHTTNTYLICLTVTVATCLGPATQTQAQSPTPPTFSSYWHDGLAELDGYQWTVKRYGQPRQGQCVMIYVTQPFSRSKAVKVNNPLKNPADTFDVIKLNLVRDFQTGIYDYNTMLSVFSATNDFTPVKISFSSAEWCGHVYEQLRFTTDQITSRFFSYFQGESSSTQLSYNPNAIAEDNLFITLRGLRNDFLQPGHTRSVPWLPSAFYRRLNHQPIAWSTAQIQRLADTDSVQVPAGTFNTVTYLVKTQNGRAGRFDIEQAYPHRVIRWSWQTTTGDSQQQWLGSGVEEGELTGSKRLAYWKLHDNGHESHLDQLGLQPQPK